MPCSDALVNCTVEIGGYTKLIYIKISTKEQWAYTCTAFNLLLWCPVYSECQIFEGSDPH